MKPQFSLRPQMLLSFRTPLSLRSVALLGRSRACLFNSVVTLFKLMVVFVLQTEHTAASVQLSAQDFVRLAEPLKLRSQVGVLALKDGSMSLEGLFLTEQVVVVVTTLGGCDS